MCTLLMKKYEGTENKNFSYLVGQNEHKYIRYIEIFQTYSFYLLSPYPYCISLFVKTVYWMLISFEFLLLLFKNLLDWETRVLFSLKLSRKEKDFSQYSSVEYLHNITRATWFALNCSTQNVFSTSQNYSCY